MSYFAAESIKSPPLTFHLFSKLPTELRLKVWTWAAQQPRDVEVRAVIVKAENNTKHAQFKSLCPVPGVLHANQESREECLKIFTKYLPEDSNTITHRIYVNPALDLLVIKTAHSLLGVDLREWVRTKHGLGIPTSHSEIPPSNDSWNRPRALWTLKTRDTDNTGKDSVILVKMFEHHGVLEQNTAADVARHLSRLGHVDLEGRYQGFWAMQRWNFSWHMVLWEIER